jgi:DNA invertase Pin-like site-specific DNA recombinase
VTAGHPAARCCAPAGPWRPYWQGQPVRRRPQTASRRLAHSRRGWVLARDHYDDGSISGVKLERPGLKQLFADIEDGLIDVVVVHKIDRLSRSLMDFS